MANKKVRKQFGLRKRRFSGNQHARLSTESNQKPPSTSASAKKLEQLAFELPPELRWAASDDECSDSDAESTGPASDCADDSELDDAYEANDKSDVPCAERCGTRLVDLAVLCSLLSSVACCKSCGEGGLDFAESRREGLASFVTITCDNPDCGESVTSSLAKESPTGKFFEVNRRAVLAMRLIGRGEEALRKICCILDMPPPMAHSTFDDHRTVIHRGVCEAARASLNQAAAHAREAKREQGASEVDQIEVTADGTWMRRGFTSLHGVFSVIAWDTGQVVDVTVLSKFCHQCASLNSRFEKQKITREKFDELRAAHAAHCQINTDRSSPGMEGQGICAMFQRSVEVRGLKYVKYIGDGDSKGFNEVRQAAPYGPECPVQKEECIGHIQKRVGNNLRELKKTKKKEKLSDGLPLGGRGRLSDRMIDMLQTYYGMAIRGSNADIQIMARHIWAALMHRASSDDKPQHQFCPIGQDSWCAWQRIKAGSQETYKHHDVLPAAVVNAIKPVWIRLSAKELLLRCTRKATQNANEKFNGMVWELCPKEGFCGRQTVEAAVGLALLKFNHGSAALSTVFEKIGCTTGQHTLAGLEAADRKRLYHAERKETQEEKKSRKRRRRLRKGLEERNLEKEGPTYAPGAF